MRFGSIHYLGLGSSRLVARARLGTRLGTQLNARFGPTRSSAEAQIRVGSWLSWDWLGTRDSTWLDLGLSPAHLARLGAWDRAGTRFGLEARPGSKLSRVEARPGSGLGARLGSEPGLAHLGSENIISETKHERRKCKRKTVRRESANV